MMMRGPLASLALALVVAVAASPAAAKSKQAERKMGTAQAAASSQAVKSGRKHCGQRAYSVSVGNPAFKDRLALWPAPCGW